MHCIFVLLTFILGCAMASELVYFIPKFCTNKEYNYEVNRMRIRDSGNDSAVVLAGYLYHGLKLDPVKGLECWVIVNSPSGTGIIATMNKIMIQTNDTLTFRSGTNPEKVWKGSVENINDEVVVLPQSDRESDLYVSYKTKQMESDRFGGFEVVLTSFKTKKDDCGTGFDCGNERCIWNGLQCDGYNNCGNNQDEEGCSSFPIWVIVFLVVVGVAVVVLALFVWQRMARR